MKLRRVNGRTIIQVEGALDVINWQEVHDFSEAHWRLEELLEPQEPTQWELEEIERPRGRIFETLDPESILMNVELREWYAVPVHDVEERHPLDGYVRFPERLKPVEGDKDDE